MQKCRRLLWTEEPSSNITFSDHTFTIGIPGTYAIDYFLQVEHSSLTGASAMVGPPVTMQIAVNGSTASTPANELVPVPIYNIPWPSPPDFPYAAVSYGTNHIVNTLAAGATLQLWITALPTVTGPID